jgi:hypothetical protein
VRLPIAALLGFGWTETAARHSATARHRAPLPPDVCVHTIAPRETLIRVSRARLTHPRRWPVLHRLNHVEGAFGPIQTVDVVPLETRSWWWLAEPIAVLAALLVAA